MNRPLRIAMILFALGTSHTRPASADSTSPGAAQEASKHFERGVKLTEDEDWRAALIEFQRAYAVDPNYRVLFNIGQCLYQLKDYPGALDAFQRYLATGADAIAAERRAEIESDIEVLKGRVARVRVSSAVVGGEVRIDDVVAGTTPLTSPVVVSAGRHRLTLSKAGMPTVTREIDLAGEEVAEAKLDPDVAPEAAPPLSNAPPVVAPTPAPAPAPHAPSPSMLPAWIAFGVGAVGVGVGAIFAVTAMNDKSELDGQCVDKSCPTTSQSVISAGQRNSVISSIGFGVGIAGVAAGAAYLVIVPSVHAHSTAASVSLVVGMQTLGAAGTF
jgi:hypothetical protein